MRIFQFTDFPTSPISGGGQQRCEQITELLKGSGQEVILSVIRKTESTWPKIFRFLGYQSIHFRFPLWRPGCGAVFGALPSLTRQLDQANHDDLVVWETTTRGGTLLGEMASKRGLRVIAIPHNLEALMVGYVDCLTGSRSLEALKDEISRLSISSLIACISLEETFLIRNLGLPGMWLPYYPPSRLVQRLLETRTAREQSRQSDRFLILGSVGRNMSTRKGLSDLLAGLNTLKQRIPVKLDLVGEGIGNIVPENNSLDIRVHGRVGDDQLKALMIDARAAIVHQEAGAGALTRVVDLITSGVPVLASTLAARSAMQYEGVTVYSDMDSLANCLSREFPIPPKPKKNCEAEASFLRKAMNSPRP